MSSNENKELREANNSINESIEASLRAFDMTSKIKQIGN